MTKKKKPVKAKAKPVKATRKPPAALVRSRPAPTVPAGEADALVPRIPGPSTAAADAISRLRSIEHLQEGFEAWAELRTLHAKAQAAYTEERARIDGQGEFLLGAVRAARNLTRQGSAESTSLAQGNDVDDFIARTTARLTDARRQLDDAVRTAEEGWVSALAEAHTTLRGRVDRTLKHARPALRLLLRGLAQNRRILHLERLTGDAPVLVHTVLSGAMPSQYGFLFDDSTDDVGQGPTMLYAEEGVKPADLRCGPPRLFELLAAAKGVFPSKGIIPMRVQQPAGVLLARFLQRGPVAEAEVYEGEGWRSLLTVEEAEVIAGWLIKLQLEGKLSVTLGRG